jgi:hypothetical protein
VDALIATHVSGGTRAAAGRRADLTTVDDVFGAIRVSSPCDFGAQTVDFPRQARYSHNIAEISMGQW